MKKLIALLSVVLFSFGVAKAGELTVTGTAKASYAINHLMELLELQRYTTIRY